MIDLAHLDELARRLSGLVPPGLREGREELQQNFKSVLQSGLARLDLVTREEFDVLRAVRQVLRLIQLNEYKRRQAPPGVRITPRGFGKDWRYPITSGFRPKS
jgi:hypothetical protein